MSPRAATLTLVVFLAALTNLSAQRTAATREFFYVGGRYVGDAGKDVMAGQMYVETLRPSKVRQKYPLVFFHGNWQTATNWIETPDGRPGWADYFLAQGYLVYLVDQPARGRSPWHESANGPIGGLSPSLVEQRFTAPEIAAFWAQAKLHTQWPGAGDLKGRRGDPVFDAFYATQVESLTSAVETQTLVQAAGTALLDKIGPSILLTHSQAGSFGWLLADARPQLVKGILAVEPAGPPFQNVIFDENRARPWGLTDIPLSYDPLPKEASDLHIVREKTAAATGLVSCWIQQDPPRRLSRLGTIPILILTAEASYHAAYDHCTADYLTQAGVRNTFLRLENLGIHGNGHMMMLEKNNFTVAEVLQKWIVQNVK
jgi:pimeloyl-ACP methyl ester carboxylesterase